MFKRFLGLGQPGSMDAEREAAYAAGHGGWLDSLSCSVLTFDLSGQLLQCNEQGSAYFGERTAKPDAAPAFQALMLGTTLADQSEADAEDIWRIILRDGNCRFEQHLELPGQPGCFVMLLCEATQCVDPLTGQQCVAVIQLDATQCRQAALAQLDSAVARKLQRYAVAHKVLRQHVTKLQVLVASSVRHMRSHGLTPDFELEQVLLQPLEAMDGSDGASLSHELSDVSHDDDEDDCDVDAFIGLVPPSKLQVLDPRLSSVGVLEEGTTPKAATPQSPTLPQSPLLRRRQQALTAVQPEPHSPQPPEEDRQFSRRYTPQLSSPGSVQLTPSGNRASGKSSVHSRSEQRAAQMDHARLVAATNMSLAEQLMADSSEQAAAHKAQLDQVLAERTEQKVAFDAALVEQQAALAVAQQHATAHKALADKLVNDVVEQKATFDAAATAQKSQLDKALVDVAEGERFAAKLVNDAVVAKATWDEHAAEEKAAWDTSAAVQKSQLDKALLDVTAGQHLAVKLVNDAVEAKASWDVQAAEDKATWDAQAAEQKANWGKQAAQEKATWDTAAAAQKSQLDKALLDVAEGVRFAAKLANDAVEAKATWDTQAAVEKASWDVQAAEDKASWDAAAAAQKSQLDKALVDAAEGERFAAKLANDAVVAKATWDEQAAEEKATWDAAAAAQKNQLDKALLDVAAGEHLVAKLVNDAAEAKASWDVQAAEDKASWDAAAVAQKSQLDKALVDITEGERFAAKLVNDAVVAKATWDAQAAEEKATWDAAAAVQKTQLDKALFDVAAGENLAAKLVNDAVEAKATWDEQAAEQKATWDTAAAEQKATWDTAAAEQKATWDTAAAEQKCQLDKALLDVVAGERFAAKLAKDAVEAKATWDEQAAEEKATWDTAAAVQKSQLDRALVDVAAAAEQKSQLDKALADVAHGEQLAAKLVNDVVEQKATFDAEAAEHQEQLDQAMQAAVNNKCLADKLVNDVVEQKATFDEELAAQQAVSSKLVADAALQKGVLDHAIGERNEAIVAAALRKQQLDETAQLAAKLEKDQVELKAGFDEQKRHFDKAVLDQVELKAEFDTQKMSFDKAVQDRTELKADFDTQKMSFDKAVQDRAELKADFDNLDMTAAHQKHQIDHLQLKSRRQQEAMRNLNSERKQAEKVKLKLQADVERIATQLANEQHNVNSLREEHDKLLRQQEVLQAELNLALGNYKPKATIDSGTPADRILSMMTDLLDGSLPNIQDILLVQSAILESNDIYQPFRLNRQLLEACNLEEDTSMSLIQLLSDTRTMHPEAQKATLSLEQFCRDRQFKINGKERRNSATSGVGSDTPEDCGPFGNLDTALGALIYPLQPPNDDDELQEPEAPTGASASRAMHRAMRKIASASSSGTEDDAKPDPAMSPQPGLVLEVEALLSSAEVSWQFDVFRLTELTQGHALSTLGFYLFHASDLIKQFRIQPLVLARYLQRVEAGYKATNPYHSSIHAADVLQKLHVILHRGGLRPGYADPMTTMACYFAAIVHDFEHTGLTNDFLINSTDPLALLYNDKAPLENHHLAAAFGLLLKPKYNFLARLPKTDMVKLRSTVIELVLATDMKQHFNTLSHFTTVHQLAPPGSVTPNSETLTRRRSESYTSEAGSNNPDHMMEEKILVPLDENERLLSLQMALKCSDLGHVAASLPMHLRWVTQLEEEFFRQGDLEKQRAWPVSPLFDRTKPGITKSQVGFFDIVVIPLYHTYCKVFTGCKPLLTFAMRNYSYWTELQNSK